jgi:hypothetical protein
VSCKEKLKGSVDRPNPKAHRPEPFFLLPFADASVRVKTQNKS